MNRLRCLALAPAAALLTATVGLPFLILAAYAFLSRGTYGGVALPWTLENWRRLADPLYAGILARSFLAAALATLLCLVLAFPLALSIARASRWKHLLLALVMLPFWTSLLVRAYAWMFLLRDTGLVNTLLMRLDLISEPLPLLYNWGAVVLGLVYAHLPFMVLPLYAALERQDPALLEAAADLGARQWHAFWRVTLPLAAPGIRAGVLLVFIPCLGTYLIPDLLGGGKTILVGTLIQNQFTTARDWPFGSAVSLALMAAVLVLLWLEVRRRKEPLL
ncbi:MAG: ABC transporter permease [Bryobacteraceae bacterium]|nr:ABC transporter permease [Bryobacteraceae bacterium]